MKQEGLQITYNDGFYVSLSLFSIIFYYIIRKKYFIFIYSFCMVLQCKLIYVI